MGKTSSAVKDRYNAKAYDEIKVRVNKGKKETIQAHAAARGESVNSFINRSINQTMAQDAAEGCTTSVVPSDVNLYSEKDNAVSAASEGLTEGADDGG